MKKTILITGWMGYIGSHAVVAFEQAWYKTVIVDNLTNSCLSAIRSIWKILWYNPIFEELDLRDKNSLDKVFQKYNFDWVIHFAWLKSVWESCDYALKYYDNNIIWSIVLFELMEKYSVKNIIFSSSATVYNPENSLPFKEKDAVWKTTNPYWTSKFLLEKMLEELSIFANFRVMNLRYFNPIWAHPSWYIWENPEWLPNNLLPYIMKVAIWELNKLSIFGGDYDTVDWTWVRDYIDVVDLIDWHVLAYKRFEKIDLNKWVFEIYNLGVWKWVSVLEMVRTSKKITWKDIKFEIVDRREGDLASVYCDASKALNVLWWKAKTSLETSLKNSWEFYNK